LAKPVVSIDLGLYDKFDYVRSVDSVQLHWRLCRRSWSASDQPSAVLKGGFLSIVKYGFLLEFRNKTIAIACCKLGIYSISPAAYEYSAI